MAYTVYYDTPGTILTYAQMQSALAALASANSWTYQTFGQSENERDIDGVIINPTGYQRTIYINGGTHGDERWSVRAVLDLLNYFNDNPSAVSSGARYIVIPVANPDGYDKNTRKNDNDYDDDSVSPWPRYVDVNRNFSAGFGAAGSSDPAGLYYHGPSALSEAEAQVITGVLTTYEPDFIVDLHTPLNLMRASAGYYVQRKAAVAAALTANGFEALTLSVDAAIGGTFRDAGWVTAKAEVYLVELATDTSIHEEVNRGICATKALLDSFNNPDHRTNIFKRDTTCVGHWRFNSGTTLGQDDQYNATLGNTGTCTRDTTNFKEGDGSLLLTNGTQYMGLLDSNLPANFPFKNGTSNDKIGITGWFAPAALPASGSIQVLVSKYDSTTSNKRSIMLSYTNVSGTYYLRFTIGYSSGTLSEFVNMVAFTPEAGVPFFVGFGYDNSTKVWKVEVYNEAGRVGGATGTMTNSASFTTARFALGASFVRNGGISSSLKYYGWIDEVAVFNAVPSDMKIAQIWAGEYTYVDYSASGTTYEESIALSGSSGISLARSLTATPLLGLSASSAQSSSAMLSVVTSLSMDASANNDLSPSANMLGGLMLSAECGFSPSVVASLLSAVDLQASASLSPAGALALAAATALSASAILETVGGVGALTYDVAISLQSRAAMEQAAVNAIAATFGADVVADMDAVPDRMIAAALSLQIDADIQYASSVAAQAMLSMGVSAEHIPTATAALNASIELGIAAILQAITQSTVPGSVAARVSRVLGESRISRVARENRIVRA